VRHGLGTAAAVPPIGESLVIRDAEKDYATIFFAGYQDQTRRLLYSNCGHPSALLLRRDGTVERLESTCTVMGLFKECDCAIEECQLCAGDTILLSPTAEPSPLTM